MKKAALIIIVRARPVLAVLEDYKLGSLLNQVGGRFGPLMIPTQTSRMLHLISWDAGSTGSIAFAANTDGVASHLVPMKT